MSIPYLSGHPFLQRKGSSGNGPKLRCVNPLSIGTPISTWAPFSIWSVMCQSPIHRDTHFYGSKRSRSPRNMARVNPLSIGTPISTLANYLVVFLHVLVSIPYPSGHPFLPYADLFDKRRYNVSIPYLSGHPFLQKKIRERGQISGLVSIPYLSGHPFLHRRTLN